MFTATGKQYRKKPVEIEAMQWNPDDPLEAGRVVVWLLDHHDLIFNTTADKRLTIQTLEGAMTASPGDWIIKGVQGEFYPCKPDIFAATYEEVTSIIPS